MPEERKNQEALPATQDTELMEGELDKLEELLEELEEADVPLTASSNSSSNSSSLSSSPSISSVSCVAGNASWFLRSSGIRRVSLTAYGQRSAGRSMIVAGSGITAGFAAF